VATKRIAPEARKALIVDAAARLLDERGFGDITVEMLRDEVGLSKGGLYHYVRSKNDVLILVCEMAAQGMLDGLERAQSHQGSPRERIDVLLSEHFDLVLRYGGALWAFFGERNRLTPDERDRVLVLERQYLHGVKAMLDEMKAAGDLRELDTTTVSEALLGMVNWVARWHRGRTPVSSLRATLVDLFVGGALHGAHPPPRPPSGTAP
jgi:AcrR family transcriptional regulator